ncbi:immunoglobulin lambda-1 light chain-like isoform X2, partial [Silurus asotus]
VSLWYTFGGGTKLIMKTGPMMKPSVSLLPPSSLQLSEGSTSLLCLLSDYSPQGALPSWTVDGVEVNEGVLTSTEDQKNGVYSRSSTLTLSKEHWEEAEVFGCTVSHHDTTQITSFRKSRCEGH